jgi:hypothetical protein
MKEIVRRHFEEFVNRKNTGVIRQSMTPDFYDHDGPGGLPTGIDGDEKMMMTMLTSMPDLLVSVEDLVAENDKVACRNIWRWTDPSAGPRLLHHQRAPRGPSHRHEATGNHRGSRCISSKTLKLPSGYYIIWHTPSGARKRCI